MLVAAMVAVPPRMVIAAASWPSGTYLNGFAVAEYLCFGHKLTLYLMPLKLSNK